MLDFKNSTKNFNIKNSLEVFFFFKNRLEFSNSRTD